MGGSIGNHGFVIGTWNVKGLTDEKLVTIFQHMIVHNIIIVCLQETSAVQAAEYDEDGFRIMLLRSSDDSWVGVGFVIAPWCISRVVGYISYSSRSDQNMAWLRLVEAGVGIHRGPVKRKAPYQHTRKK